MRCSKKKEMTRGDGERSKVRRHSKHDDVYDMLSCNSSSCLYPGQICKKVSVGGAGRRRWRWIGNCRSSLFGGFADGHRLCGVVGWWGSVAAFYSFCPRCCSILRLGILTTSTLVVGLVGRIELAIVPAAVASAAAIHTAPIGTPVACATSTIEKDVSDTGGGKRHEFTQTTYGY